MTFLEKLQGLCPTILRAGSLKIGWECPEGWEKLVERLSVDLEHYAVEHNRKIRVEQVKSKFGSLRYYISGGDEHAYEMIRDVERQSVNFCEVCGEGGRQQGKGWIVTVCEKHAPSQG